MLRESSPARDLCVCEKVPSSEKITHGYRYLAAASFPKDMKLGHPGPGKAILNTDATLNQLVQFGALRLGCDRAILSFIDFQHEYAVAEATRWQSPKSRKTCGHPELVVGVAKLPNDNTEGMCPETVRAFKDENGDWESNGPIIYASRDRYIITDMRADPRYANKPCVTSFKPAVRSFIGVPVISPLGWILGAYMLGHSEVRNFTDDDVEVMQEISSAIVDHLELVKAKHDRARNNKLMKGLAEFMERESPVPHERTLSMSTRTSEKSHSEAPQSEPPDSAAGDEPVPDDEEVAPDEIPGEDRPVPHHNQSASTVQTSHSEVFSPKEGDHSTPPSTPPEGPDQDPFDATVPLQQVETHEEPEELAAPPGPESTISDEVKKTFLRAANVIADSMNTDGMMFIDAVPNSFGSRSNITTPYEKPEDPFMSDTGDSTSNEAEDVHLPKYLAKYVQPHCRLPDYAFHPPEGDAPIPEPVLQRWIKRYPRGHIFTADEYGPIDCRYGPGANILKQRRARRRSSRVMNDVSALFEQFPHVRYVIFLPLWHFQRECWFAAAFGWVSFDSQQALDYSDLNLLTAFCNSVMAEVSRIEALSVSRAKSDFISSISHELRSPLHGILASGELLREALDDPNLLSMIDMIDSCGTTLLDTFNNLLDYAKINNVSKAAGDDDEAQGRRIRKSETVSTDLSVLVQDVVEAVNLGHTSKTAFQNGQQTQSVYTTLAELARAEEEFPDHDVIVTMNIEKRSSWLTKLDPGAWKRIVMNIVGNALKYTRAGHVEVGLKICDVPDERKRGVSRRSICFSVRDTGIGMSADYLKYQLFTPFAQENNLSPGTGLGLSIVNQIVKGLGGKLDVQSQIGKCPRENHITARVKLTTNRYWHSRQSVCTTEAGHSRSTWSANATHRRSFSIRLRRQIARPHASCHHARGIQGTRESRFRDHTRSERPLPCDSVSTAAYHRRDAGHESRLRHA